MGKCNGCIYEYCRDCEKFNYCPADKGPVDKHRKCIYLTGECEKFKPQIESEIQK